MDDPLSQALQDIHSPDLNKRRMAAWQLGRLHHSSGLPALLNAAQDPSEGVRLRVYEALGAYRDDSARSVLINGLQDEDEEAQAMAAQSLVNYPAPDEGLESYAEHLQHLLSAESADVRGAVAQVLGAWWVSEAAPHLALCLRDDASAEVRYAARNALIALAEASTPALIDLLEPSLSVGVLIDLLEVLGQIGDPHARDALMPYSQHEDKDVQALTQWALGRMS